MNNKNFSNIAEDFDAFLVDLWGVVHDGENLYPGAKECLEYIKGQGKKVIFISNAPRRAAAAQLTLDKLGIGRDLYECVITSGETAHQFYSNGGKKPGIKFYYIGQDKDEATVDGCGFSKVTQISDADFLLNTGFGSEAEQPNVTAELMSAKKKDLPMLCLNPDIEVVKISGSRHPCAGAIAEQYKEMGGKVIYFGKPYEEIYKLAFAKLAGIDKSRVIAIGDNLLTDIKGANDAGIKSLHVTGGVQNTGIQLVVNKPNYTIDEWNLTSYVAAHKSARVVAYDGLGQTQDFPRSC